MNTTEIENLLRQAPNPTPPPGLKQRVSAQASSFLARQAVKTGPVNRAPGTWLSRWWPALGPAAVSLACAALFTAQQIEINKLETQANQQKTSASSIASPAPAAETVSPSGASPEQQEIQRLKTLVSTLAAEVSRLEQMQAENQKLRAELAGAAAAALTPEEIKSLEDARQRAMRIQCVNNLKQLGLAVKVWALDNGDMTPPNILYMTNEMSTPKILACPADTAHPAAKGGWADYTAANCSYEYLAASTQDGLEPTRVLFRCPIHGNITLCDGSVQSGVAKDHPDWLVQRDGKLFYQPAGQ